MTLNNDIYKVINYILLIAIFSLLFWQITVFVKNQAIDGCAKYATYTQELPNENARVIYPIKDLYDKCLQDKGIK